MSKHLAAISLAAVLAACGVQQSSLDANTTVTISGKALSADGKPLASSKVVLVKELDLGEVVGGLFLTAASLGVACLADHPPAVCARNAHLATTDGAGKFSFALKGGETQGSFGTASTMEVVTRAAGGLGGVAGPSAMAEFQVQTATLSLPDLRIWDANTGWTADDRVTWQALPASYGNSPAYSVELHDSRGNEWWAATPARPGDRIDPRVQEDLIGSFDVAARARGTANGTTVDYTYRSGWSALRGRGGVPPSRGARCAQVTSQSVGLFGACPLTMGAAGLSSSLSGSMNGVAVDLGVDRSVSLVVIRGCVGQCRVSVSSDGSTWTDGGTVTAMYAVKALVPAQHARFVRVMPSGDAAALRQISVW